MGLLYKEKQLLLLATLVAVVAVVVYRWYKLRQAVRQAVRQPSELAAPSVDKTPLNPSELIAEIQAEHQVPVAAAAATVAVASPDEPDGFETKAFNRLKLIIAALRELQLHTTTQVYNYVPAEFDSGENAIERMSQTSSVTRDETTAEYQIMMQLAEREFTKLQATTRGREMLQTL